MTSSIMSCRIRFDGMLQLSCVYVCKLSRNRKTKGGNKGGKTRGGGGEEKKVIK